MGHLIRGTRGGQIIAQGTPEEVAKNEVSHTARFLRIELNSNNNSNLKNLLNGEEKVVVKAKNK